MMKQASIVVALVLLLQSLGWATTHHVYPLGRTIQEAINIAQAGDTVLVHRGYYRQTLTLKPQITVCSTHGSAQTTIDGADLDSSTVCYSQWGPPCILGGPNAGFTLKGGSVYRLWCRGTLYYHCGGLYAYDLIIESAQANFAVKLDNCEDIEFTDVRMIGEAWMGWEIKESEGIQLNSVDIQQGTTYAIYVESTTFYADDLTVRWASGAGLRTLWSADHVFHSEFTNCGYGVSAYGLGFLGPDTFYDVTFDSCGTGISAYPQQQDLELNVSNCYFTACTTGVSLTRAQGSVTGCHFEDIYDTGLRTEDYGGQLSIGDAGGGAGNWFDGVDGIGIHLDSGARATVLNNEFYNVLGTGIQCETGASGTEIRDCVLDGSGGCFEGIVTRESGTMVEIRECTLRDYSLGGFPVPRAVYVNDHTAWLGYWDDLDVDDPGSNSFTNTGFNLYYTGPPGTPPEYLRAQLNW